MHRLEPWNSVRTVVLACLLSCATAIGQPPSYQPDGTSVRSGPPLPVGRLSDRLGERLTIEGVKATRGKVESGTLLVDTVNGERLAKPIPMVVHGAYLADHNLQRGILRLPDKERCVLKGYEDGAMIGVAPAVAALAKEEGWEDPPMSAVPWQWRSHFVALVVVEPAGLEIEEPAR